MVATNSVVIRTEESIYRFRKYYSIENWCPLLGPRNRFIDFKSSIVVNLRVLFLFFVFFVDFFLSHALNFFQYLFPRVSFVVEPVFFRKKTTFPIFRTCFWRPVGSRGVVRDVKKCTFFIFNDFFGLPCPQSIFRRGTRVFSVVYHLFSHLHAFL